MEPLTAILFDGYIEQAASNPVIFYQHIPTHKGYIIIVQDFRVRIKQQSIKTNPTRADCHLPDPRECGTIDIMRRWILFLISILVGIAVGVFYGWFIQPIAYTNTSPGALKQDYQTDYVLMVAEIYSLEENAANATRRLASLGDLPGAEIVRQAILFAEQSGYNEQDLDRLRRLRLVLEEATSPLMTPGP